MPLAIFQNFGVWEILLLLLVLLLVFGPKRLPEMGRSLGRGMREFKDSVTGKTPYDDEDEVEATELTAPPAAAVPPAPAATTAPAPAATTAPPAEPAQAEPAQAEPERVSN